MASFTSQPNPYADLSDSQIRTIMQLTGGSGQGTTISDSDVQKVRDDPSFLNSSTIGGSYTPNPGSQSYGYQGPSNSGSVSGGISAETIAALMKSGVLGGGNDQSAQKGSSYGMADTSDPMNDISKLGAAALGERMAINPNPSNSKFDISSGTSKVPSASLSADVPDAPEGPWNTQPGVMMAANKPTPTPPPPSIYPAQQATAAQYNPGQAFAMAPQPAAPRQTPAPAAPGVGDVLDQSQGSNLWAKYGGGQPPTMGTQGGGMAGAGAAMGGVPGSVMSIIAMKNQQNQAAAHASYAGAGPQSLGTLGSDSVAGDPDPDSNYIAGAGSGSGAAAAGGASPAAKQAGLALINSAQHVGDSMQNIGSWVNQPSHIPSPDEFQTAQQQSVKFNPMTII